MEQLSTGGNDSEQSVTTGGDNSRSSRTKRSPARLNDYEVYKVDSANQKQAATQMGGACRWETQKKSEPTQSLANYATGNYSITNQELAPGTNISILNSIKAGTTREKSHSRFKLQQRHFRELQHKMTDSRNNHSSSLDHSS